MADAVSTIATRGLTATRDRLARGLLAIGATPNVLTLIGLALTLAAAGTLGAGIAVGNADAPPPWADGAGNWWLWATAALIILAGAMDVLDGAVARLGNKGSDAGAVLDSSLDRFSDMGLFVAMIAGFAWRGNFTYALLGGLALSHAVMISYVRARAEDVIANCKVGYWERGERVAALLIAVAFYQVPAMLWLLATLPLLTAVRRITYSLRVLSRRQRTGEDISVTQIKPIGGGLWKLALWRYRRGTFAYDVVTGLNIAWIVLAPISAAADPLRAWLS